MGGSAVSHGIAGSLVPGPKTDAYYIGISGPKIISNPNYRVTSRRCVDSNGVSTNSSSHQVEMIISFWSGAFIIV
jgi:hypothetical protein